MRALIIDGGKVRQGPSLLAEAPKDGKQYARKDGGWAEVAGGGGGTTAGVWDTLATPAISAGALTLDLSEPTLFAVGLDQNVTDLSFANLPTGKAPVFAVAFTQDAIGGRTVAWPASVIGTPPNIGSDPGAVTVVSLAYIGGDQYVISGAIYA